MPVIVSDTSPIRALVHLERMELLGTLYGQILIPPIVVWELAHPGDRSTAVVAGDYADLEVRAPTDRAFVERLQNELDPGESEALALAIETRAERVLVDDFDARMVAQRLGLKATGVFGVLLLAKEADLIDEVAPMIDRLRTGIGFFVSRELEAEVRRRAGE